MIFEQFLAVICSSSGSRATQVHVWRAIFTSEFFFVLRALSCTSYVVMFLFHFLFLCKVGHIYISKLYDKTFEWRFKLIFSTFWERSIFHPPIYQFFDNWHWKLNCSDTFRKALLVSINNSGYSSRRCTLNSLRCSEYITSLSSLQRCAKNCGTILPMIQLCTHFWNNSWCTFENVSISIVPTPASTLINKRRSNDFF